MKPNVKQAIAIIQDLADLEPKYAAYWVFPNVILTLCGARTIADAVFYFKNSSQRQQMLADIKKTMPVVASHLPLIWSSFDVGKNRSKEEYVSYDILTEQGISQITGV